MRRKSVRQLLKSLGRLRKTVEIERDRISQRLGGRLAAPPGAAGAHLAVLQHLEAELAALVADLAAAEDKYALVKQRPGELRRQRDRAVAEVYRLHRSLRRLLTSISDVWSRAGGGSTPEDPHQLVAEASWTLDFLRELERDPPPPVLGVSLDVAAAIADLEPVHERLEAVLAELTGAESDAKFAQSKADAAMAHTEDVGPWVVQAIESLAGLSQAERVGVRL